MRERARACATAPSTTCSSPSEEPEEKVDTYGALFEKLGVAREVEAIGMQKLGATFVAFGDRATRMGRAGAAAIVLLSVLLVAAVG